MPSLNINDATDAAHVAAMEVDEWAQEFVLEWMRPLIEMEQERTLEGVIVLWKQMPPEMHAQMKKDDPEQYAEAERKIMDLEKRGKHAT